MKENYAEDFGPFEGAIWLNCAHQGALPRVAAAEAEEAIAWKRAPWNLTTERFSSVPQRLKRIAPDGERDALAGRRRSIAYARRFPLRHTALAGARTKRGQGSPDPAEESRARSGRIARKYHRLDEAALPHSRALLFRACG